MPNQKGSTTIYLILIVILASALVWTNLDKLAFLKSSQHTKTLSNNPAPTPSPSFSNVKCKKNGTAPQKDLQTKYQVKEGDTLTSIAQTQLGNKSRTNDILNLNRSLNELYDKEATLEAGLELNIPRQDIPKNSGKLELFYGKFVGVAGGFWIFDGDGVTTNIPQIQFDDLANKDDIKQGVCYAVITDIGDGVVLSITPQ